MKTSIFVLSFLLGLISTLKNQSKIQKLAQAVQASSAPTYTCTTAIQNYKRGLADDYQAIIARGTQYTDPNFGANTSSLFWPNFTTNELAKFSSTRWNRLPRINSRASLYGENGFTHDIIQGQLGNCYFLGGIPSIAEDDDRIKRVFVNEQINSAGIYAFNVFVRGIPTIITVDDQVPVSNSNQPIFAAIGSDNSIWGPLLEKAWSKVNGNYERTEGGYGHEPVSFLTNFPSRFYPVHRLSESAFYNLVEDADSNNFLMTLSISSKKSDRERCNLNLPCSHLYTLLDVHTVQSRNNRSQSIRLYKFRNPWRSDAEFTGKWNDKSPLWKANGEDYDQQVGHVDSNDGIMWVEESEIKSTFTDFFIAYYEKDWETSWYNRENDDGTTQDYFFTLDQNTFLNIKLDLYSLRMYSDKCKKSLGNDPTRVELRVEQLLHNRNVTMNTQTMISLDFNGGINYTQTALPAGKYRVTVRPSWQPDDVKDYTLAILSRRPISITDSNGQTRQTGGLGHDLRFKNNNQNQIRDRIRTQNLLQQEEIMPSILK